MAKQNDSQYWQDEIGYLRWNVWVSDEKKDVDEKEEDVTQVARHEKKQWMGV